MPRLSLLFVGAALALTLALPAQPTGEPLELTIEQLVDKNIAAKGGR